MNDCESEKTMYKMLLKKDHQMPGLNDKKKVDIATFTPTQQQKECKRWQSKCLKSVAH